MFKDTDVLGTLISTNGGFRVITPTEPFKQAKMFFLAGKIPNLALQHLRFEITE